MGDCGEQSGETGERMHFCPVQAPLHFAAKKNDVTELQKHLQNGEDINMIAVTVPPLYVACILGHIKIIEALVKRNCDINATTVELLQTGLHVAVSKNFEPIVKYLVKHGALLDKQDSYGATPLYLAAQYGHINTASHLIKSGADVNITDLKGLSPLAIATLNGGNKLAKLLIKNKARLDMPDKSGNTALFHAMKSGQRQICQMLTAAGASVNLMNNAKEYPVSIAAMYGNVAILDDLIKHKCDVNVISAHGTPVFLAVQRQHVKALQILVAAGADVTKVDGKHRDPLVEALHQSKCNIDLVKELISSGSDVRAKCKCHEVSMHSALSKWNGLVIAYMVLSDCDIGHILEHKLAELVGGCPSTCTMKPIYVNEVCKRLENGMQPFSLKSECRKAIKSAVGPMYYKVKIQKLKQAKYLENYLLYNNVTAAVCGK